MKRKIRIQRVSFWSLIVTLIFAFIFAALSIVGRKQFTVLQDSTEQYILCENAAKQLQDGSDYLTEEVRLFAMTGNSQYMDLYFKEADITKRREHALEDLKQYFDGTDSFTSLQSALYHSVDLMNTEYYSMRLVCEAQGISQSNWPDALQSVELSDEDSQLSIEEKMQKAQDLVCNNDYQNTRTIITDKVTECMNDLITLTRNHQGRATTIFSDMYHKLEVGVIVLVALMLLMSLIVRKLIVEPLISYNESIKHGEIFPVLGAEELQNLALTYNQVFQENLETQRLIRHQAEHDALTGILNRRSFEKLLHVYEEGDNNFALILVDVDVFKSVNDTYGHAVGDIVLKNVATYLKTAFRSIDYVCRIGGDEFAVIMVEMTSDLQYTIKDKIAAVSEQLAHPEEGVPKTTLSVGVAFTDRENPGESLFQDADKALYHVKENGRNGCGFY